MMTRRRILENPRRLAKRSRALVPLLLAITSLAGCAQPLRVTGDWNEGATRPQSFKKLLIVGVSPDYKQRCNFEAVLATTLRSETVEAIASCSAMKADEPLSRENVERVVASLGADGVLATRLVAATTSAKEGGTRDTRGSSMYKATDMGYGYYGMPVVHGEFVASPPMFSLETEFEVTTQLFETRGGTLVYRLTTTGKTRDSARIVIDDISAAISVRLRQAGLIS
jgi:hypothetical protein